jgi:hypothetical protein
MKNENAGKCWKMLEKIQIKIFNFVKLKNPKNPVFGSAGKKCWKNPKNPDFGF